MSDQKAASVTAKKAGNILSQADLLQRRLGANLRDRLVDDIYSNAASMAERHVSLTPGKSRSWDQKLDRVLTSRLFGLPLMALGLGLIFWITVIGANYPSQMLATGLFWIEDQGAMIFNAIGLPWWVTGFVWHGVYKALAWVIAVMLPPMAIFFPIFTFLEDLGYLPRVAFNMDRLFKFAGAHGKQALSMSMGFGCNAAGIIATRIIDSPRERLIAILTNNFVPCNGRFPTLILLASVFVGARFKPAVASAVAAGTVVLIVIIGVIVTLLVSTFLSRTVLKGEPSSFTLELPPYRRPHFRQIIYTSLIDRTIFVLWRAVVMAAPAGAVIWILSAVNVGGESLAGWFASLLDPVGKSIGLDGVILMAYVIAIPANEIIVPVILMAYTGAAQMMDIAGRADLEALLIGDQNWTLLTAVCLMLFSLLHNPCSTTIFTIWKETGSRKWTIVGALMPLAIAFAVCFLVANIWRLIAGI